MVTPNSSSANAVEHAASRPTQSEGSQGPLVRVIQTRLNIHGFNVGKPDARFGPKTKQEVKNFQLAKGLSADGNVGPKTWAALDAAPSKGAASGTARLTHQPNGRGLTTGSITVKGRTYKFNSGSSRLFSVPQGTYRVRAHRNSRSDAGFVRDGVGFSFLIEDASRPTLTGCMTGARAATAGSCASTRTVVRPAPQAASASSVMGRRCVSSAKT